VCIGSDGTAFSLVNDEVAIRQLLKQLTPADFVILEATGGLEMPVASGLAAAGIAVAIVNPRQVRDFARATGRLAKTATGWMPRYWRVSVKRFDPRHAH
jgi:transposase